MGRRLIIAGGGIGGMAAALALERAGVEVCVYERSPAFTEVGAGMSLWPNATRILKSWGVLEDLLATGEPVTHFDLLRPDGATISEISMRGFDTPTLCLHRADLHRALIRAHPPSRLVSNGRLLRFAQKAGSGVTAEFAGGLRADADGLIGADGVNSAVRAQLHGAAPPIYRGYCIWRGIAPQVPGERKGHITETWGRGQRFGVMPIGGGRVCWYATRNGPEGRPEGAEGRKGEILRLFAGWHHPIQDLIEATDPAEIMRNEARDRTALSRWGEGCVTLLGDAAHPITPNVGQGACMAIEDAACLAKAVAAHPDLPSAFASYEAARRGRTAFVGNQSRRIGAIGQLENPFAVAARNVIARVVLAVSHDMTLNSVYAHEV